jgi:hypothetical protein
MGVASSACNRLRIRFSRGGSPWSRNRDAEELPADSGEAGGVKVSHSSVGSCRHQHPALLDERVRSPGIFVGDLAGHLKHAAILFERTACGDARGGYSAASTTLAGMAPRWLAVSPPRANPLIININNNDQFLGGQIACPQLGHARTVGVGWRVPTIAIPGLVSTSGLPRTRVISGGS